MSNLKKEDKELTALIERKKAEKRMGKQMAIESAVWAGVAIKRIEEYCKPRVNSYEDDTAWVIGEAEERVRRDIRNIIIKARSHEAS